MDYLLMPIAAPMQSWGDMVVSGDDRPTLPFPTHSGLGGLICAALGIDRQDEDRLRRVHNRLRFLVLEVSEGRLQRDYYSVENIVRASGSGGGSIIGNKYYLADAVFLAAVSLLPDPPFSLEEIGRALLNPYYSLYAGRRAYPLSLPPVYHVNGIPQILEWDNPFVGMMTLLQDESERNRVFPGQTALSKDSPPPRFYCDAEDKAHFNGSDQVSAIPYSIRDRYHGWYRNWGYRSFEGRNVYRVHLNAEA
jgi:CRISPR-associated Cas5-like protein